jgi:uncharacterized protein (DUF1810 family)
MDVASTESHVDMQSGLERFVAAQTPVFPDVVRELSSGHKTSHWMWFIFPQIRGLGRSETARYYAISSLEEARAYAQHPLLGPRLQDCTALVIASSAASLVAIFGPVDALKFCSCMTLFLEATSTNEIFQHALDRYCDGKRDQATLQLIGVSNHG